MTERILVVEDDPAILRGLSDSIRAEGYDVLVASDGETAYHLIGSQHPDLVVLDVMLPRLSGTDVCRLVRAEGVRTPIVMLTARGAEEQRVAGLDAGADDYVTKPFLLRELLARIRGLLRHRRAWSVERDQLQREVRTAAEVQQRLLPQSKPSLGTLDWCGLCHPAGGVGGDYYDFIELAPGLVAVVLADVAGKGIPAALSMASVHGVVRTEARRFHRRPADLVASLNTTLYASLQPGRYATLFYGVYDDNARTLTYVNAGHPPPILLPAEDAGDGGRALNLEACAPPVGLFPRLTLLERTVQMRRGDWLVSFSDGVTEAVDGSGDEFGRHRLLRLVQRHRQTSAEAMCGALHAAVQAHASGGPQFDDLTMIVGKGQ